MLQRSCSCVCARTHEVNWQPKSASTGSRSCNERAETKSVVADCWLRLLGSSWRLSYLYLKGKQIARVSLPLAVLMVFMCHLFECVWACLCAQLADAVKVRTLPLLRGRK